jgi:hypothetical protein
VLLLPRLIGKEIIARPDAQVCRAPGIRRGNDIYVLVLVKGLWAGEGLAQSKSIKNTIVEQHPRWKEALLFVFMFSFSEQLR